MLTLLWRLNLGRGVIDCAVSHSQRRVIAGDVDGDLTILSYVGDKEFARSYDMPIWGVDISAGADMFAVGLASKAPSKGAFVVVKSGDTILEEHFETPVWDVKIIEGINKVVASTWGNGVCEYDLSSSSTKRILEGKEIFGISIGEQDQLFLTVAREGLYSLTPSHDAALVSRSPVACYNNVVSGDTAIFGSSSNIVSFVNLRSHSDTHYKYALRSPCAIATLEDNIIIGDLEGNLVIAKMRYPNTPIFHEQFDGGIWNIAVDKEDLLVFLACGDGSVYCHQFDSTQIGGKPHLADSMAMLKSALRGVKIFISYAREDEAAVRVLYEGLTTMGCEPWVDFKDLLPGQDWKFEIKRAIKTCDFFVVCLSKHSVTKRGFVQKEIRDALEIVEQMAEGQIFLIPMRLDDCDIPESIADRHYVNLFSDDGLQKLLTAMYHQKTRP